MPFSDILIGGKLFLREWNITIGEIDIHDLAVDFKVSKTLKSEPNTCELKVYNPSPNTRNAFTIPKKLSVRIEAGYKTTGVTQIYLGEVRSLNAGSVEGPDRIAELSSGDGETSIQTARLSVPIGAGTPTSVAFMAIVKSMGISPGNAAQFAAKFNSKGVVMFPVATALVGFSERRLSDFCRSASIEWSIQDGAFQFLDLGKALTAKPYILRADTGMIGSPKLDKDGKVSAEMLMLPDIRPGLPVIFDSEYVKGVYRIVKADYTGQTQGADWTIKIDCDRPGSTA